MSQDDRIFEIATALIRGSSMKFDRWQATVLASVHPGLSLPLQLEDGERILICAQFPEGDWYAWTTRWLVSSLEDRLSRMRACDVARLDVGMFKGHPAYWDDPHAPLQSLIATARSSSGTTLRFRYEVGYASMAPLQCHQYWVLKHPILHKLLTPAEVEEYQSSRQRK